MPTTNDISQEQLSDLRKELHQELRHIKSEIKSIDQKNDNNFRWTVGILMIVLVVVSAVIGRFVH